MIHEEIFNLHVYTHFKPMQSYLFKKKLLES